MSSEKHSLSKLARILDEGLHQPQFSAPASSNKVNYYENNPKKEIFQIPRKGPNTQTRCYGRPIDIQTARALRTTILGLSSHLFTNDWKKFFFKFRDPKSKIPYAIDASLPGPRPLSLCVQAYILKQLMFSDEKQKNILEERKNAGQRTPRPSKHEQELALVDAFVNLLWKVALPINLKNKHPHPTDKPVEKRQVIVTLIGEEACFSTKNANFVSDGITEKVWIYSLYTKLEVQQFVRRNIHYFCHRYYPGGIMLLFSLVLSHTCESIVKDMGSCQKSLLTDNARSTQALVNLLLSGSAAAFLHNGVISCDKRGDALKRPLNGVAHRSEFGFLFYDKHEMDDRRTQVGSMLKTPILPIWITQVNGTHGILFCTTRELISDWRTERFFSLHYYNGHNTQQDEALLTIDTRHRAEGIAPDRQITMWDDEEEIEQKQPSLELCIFTKWPQCEIEWNCSPFY